MVIYDGKTKIFKIYPCINFQHYHLGIIMLFAMQNKKSSHICLVFQPDMMESQNKVSDCKQASWTLFI